MTALAYRPATEPDARFILGSWLASYRNAHQAGLISRERWNDVMGIELRDVLLRPGCVTRIAYNPGAADPGLDAYGWIAGEPSRREPLVHYCYVKHPYRRMGIARGLLAALGIDPRREFHYTCRTKVVSQLPIPMGRHRPLIARGIADDESAAPTREEIRHGQRK